MATRVFELLNGGVRFGNTLKTAAGSLYPGLFAKLDSSGSTVSTSGSTTALKPLGFLFGDRTLAYRPTTRVYDSGEVVTVVYGIGTVLFSTDLMDEATLPTTPGTTLYAAASGKWTANVTSNKVGTYIQTTTRYEPVGGTGSSQSLAVVEFALLP